MVIRKPENRSAEEKQPYRSTGCQKRSGDITLLKYANIPRIGPQHLLLKPRQYGWMIQAKQALNGLYQCRKADAVQQNFPLAGVEPATNQHQQK